jgi:ABC-type Mn2+/Zn2+ transport system permease subunit
VIQDFIDSWHLFATTYLVGWLVAALLSLLGVIVVARDQVFLGAAISQVSTLGVALAMWLGTALGEHAPEWMHSGRFLTFTAIALSVAASLLTTRAGGPGRESRDAVTGWLFLLGAAGSIIVVAHSPHGLEEVQRLFSSSSLINAQPIDLYTFAALALVAVAIIATWWRAILLWVMDPTTAAAAGVRVVSLQLSLAAGLGVALGLSIRASGLIYTFGCLVLPPLIAKNLSREVRAMFVLAPLIGIAVSVLGFVIANHHDYPPGQMTVVLLCLVLPATWIIRRIRNPHP